MTPRQKARAAGEAHYDGRACDVCHGTQRFVSNKKCARHADKQHLEARGYLERKYADNAKWRDANPDYHLWYYHLVARPRELEALRPRLLDAKGALKVQRIKLTKELEALRAEQ